MIRHLLIDLDDTLYPASSPMSNAINIRIVEFLAHYFGISVEAAELKRKEKLRKYGATLEWLQKEHNFTAAKEYFEFVHPESELSEISFDPGLRPLLQSLKLPMTVLTNGSYMHALRVLKFLNVDDLFLGIYDVLKNNLHGKPSPDAYMNALHSEGFTPDETLFVDDNPQYIEGYTRLGGRAVLVTQNEQSIHLLPDIPNIPTIYGLKSLLENTPEFFRTE
jgi:putative hydrolase of the HAD superfamily